ncbi:MAG: tyrosine-type recombinase/integrase [Dermatophilaceae bacterium]|nr:tyrosine-type recombinase/integrase [Actinomycetales bacterium]
MTWCTVVITFCYGGLKTKTSQRRLVLPGWLVELLTARRERLGGADDAPVFPSAAGTYRDRANVGRAFRDVRADSEFDWVKTHTCRKTVATFLDISGASARVMADQLGHAQIAMTQNVYMGRRAVDSVEASMLDGFDFGAGQEGSGTACGP